MRCSVYMKGCHMWRLMHVIAVNAYVHAVDKQLQVIGAGVHAPNQSTVNPL